MTKINRLTIHGFKSFAHKTEVPFNNEFNCILGPNGSGKSNIGDALCFVLGRISAKSMRAEKAANLIFNGGKKNKPASAGSVEIEFCNKNKVFPMEDKEVVVNRTITKKGSSTYRVNGQRKTRSEVVDLLSHGKINPDGYNVILQGDITRFVTMSPVERRKVIEEISDVAIYEEKKHKADLELNKVEEKLNSADIILKERKTHLKELKKDRDQALKFKELKDQIDSNKATYLHYQIIDKEESKKKYDEMIGKHQAKIDKAEAKVGDLKTLVEEKKVKIQELNAEIEQKGEKEQVQVHREIEDLKVEIAKGKTRMSTLKDEINKIKLRKDQFKQELKELDDKTSSYNQKEKEFATSLQRKKQESAQIEGSIAQFKKKHKIESSQEFEDDLMNKDKLIESKQEEVQKVRQNQQELLREKDKIEYQLETIDEKILKVKSVAQEHKDQIKLLQQHKTNFKNATLRLNKSLEQDSSYASQVANARRSIVSLQEKHATLNAKAMSIRASISSNQAVKSIIDNKNKFKGVYGTVAELGQVKRKFGPALEASAGGRMHHIVVDTDETASQCIKYLKSNKLGSASFIPLNRIRSMSITPENKKLLNKNGVHDFALNLVSYDSRFEKAFSYVFGNSLVVEDIDTARNVGVGTIKMATLDGNLSESSGVMKGGFRKRMGSGFKEKDSLEEIENLEGEIANAQGVISNIESKRAANEKEITSLRTLKAELEGEVIKLEKSLHLNTDDLDANTTLKKELREQLSLCDEKLQAVQRNITSINTSLAQLKSQKQMLRSKVNELRNPRLLAQLSAFEESKQKCREDILRLENNLTNSKNQMSQLLAPEREKILEIMKQQEKEDKTFSEEIIRLQKEITIQDKELTVKEKQSKVFYSKYRELFTKREALSTAVNKSETDIESVRQQTRDSEREVNLVSLKNAEIKAKLAGLTEEFVKYKNAKLLKNKPVDELKREINRFEVMLAQMSAVNMKALEVYDQVNEEFEKLIEKKSSLEKEKTDVFTLMNEIETKKTENFMRTFKFANKNFEDIFGRLFNKGKAYLELENPKKPFDDGLNIKVKLSGNRYMDIKSLSGGEKTLTALSFIFAIQEYQPASFYILDEIDAALDKHNAETLAKLIRSYSDTAQYIVISHNDSLISEADTLYGISMKEGISKITSLKI
jgi:chromosome segregation protein